MTSARFGVALLALLAPIAACSGGSTTPPTQTLVSGDAILSASATELTLRQKDLTLLRFGADAFQLGVVRALDDHESYDPYWLVTQNALFTPSPPADLRWLVPTHIAVNAQSDPQHSELGLSYPSGLTAKLLLSVAADDGHFSLKLLPDPLPAGVAIAYLRLRAKADSEEAFYGLGERSDTLNQRGKVRAIQLEGDLQAENASDENHVPVPFVIGTRGWGWFVESQRVGSFDLATQAADLIEVTFGTADDSAQGLLTHLYAAASPLDLVKPYYETTGFPRLPAAWALGPWIWRDENRDQAEVEDDIEKIRSLDLAGSGLWIDRPYASAVNTFDFKPSQFPDPPHMIQKAHDYGLRMALWSTPYLEPTAEPLRSMALSAGYFPPQPGTRLNGWSDPIDLTNPAAYAFWHALIERYRAMGIEGFKLDYAEDVVPSLFAGRSPWRFADGSTERTMHYGYTRLYHQIYAETLDDDANYLLCRTGRWGDQIHASVIWPGDKDADFKHYGEMFTNSSGQTKRAVGGLPATVIEGISLGVSGFPFFAADTGGYLHSPPNKETFTRWFEQTALSTVMNVGDSSSEPPWVFTSTNGRDQATLDLYRQFARLHVRLFPYEWSYARNLKNDGRPIQRAIGLVHPELGEHPDDEYLFGDHLLVAPVLEAGATRRRVLFPPGQWVQWFTNQVFDAGSGTTMEVDAPLDSLPLFLAAGGIVPLLRDTIDSLAPTTVPELVDSYATHAGPLTVRVMAGPPSRFMVFDGTVIDQAAAAGGLDLTLTAGGTFTEGYLIEVLATASAPSNVSKNGAGLNKAASAMDFAAGGESWWWENGRLSIRLSGAGMLTVR